MIGAFLKILGNALKALIFVQIFQGSIALSDTISPDGMIDNVVVTFYAYESLTEMRAALTEDRPGEDWSNTEGYSECWRNVEKNVAYCDIWIVEPVEVDGERTLTVGHEVLHGRYGPEYHK